MKPGTRQGAGVCGLVVRIDAQLRLLHELLELKSAWREYPSAQTHTGVQSRQMERTWVFRCVVSILRFFYRDHTLPVNKDWREFAVLYFPGSVVVYPPPPLRSEFAKTGATLSVSPEYYR
jgi:hypothetical protein